MARNVAPIKNGTTAVARQAKRHDVKNRSAKDTSAEIADRSARDTVSVAAAWSFCVSEARRLRRSPVWKSKFYGAFVLNHRVVLYAIDATPAR